MTAVNLAETSLIRGQLSVRQYLATTRNRVLRNLLDSNQLLKINSIVFANMDTVDRRVTLELQRNSQVYKVLSNLVVPANSKVSAIASSYFIYLEEGDQLYAYSDATVFEKVNLICSYEQVSNISTVADRPDTEVEVELPDAPIEATGGTVTEADGYRIHTFYSSGTFEITSLGNFTNEVEYLIVAGGGGGGSRINSGGGGGGAGGMLSGVRPVSVGSYPIVVGAGGAGGVSTAVSTGSNGEDSSFDSLTAIGGGGGGQASTGSSSNAGLSGGSGGGEGGNSGGGGGGAGIPGQGRDGGAAPGTTNTTGGGGGGGKANLGGQGNTGNVAGAGGNGAQWPAGSGIYYAGGGAGGGQLGSRKAGGLGGGGAGGQRDGADLSGRSGLNGAPNTGGGGGGGAGSGTSLTGAGGNGGSGIVIIRYPLVS